MNTSRILVLNKALWSFEAKFAQKSILEKKNKKTIIEFKISSFEYSIVSSFFLNKVLSSLGTKFARKKYFGDEI